MFLSHESCFRQEPAAGFYVSNLLRWHSIIHRTRTMNSKIRQQVVILVISLITFLSVLQLITEPAPLILFQINPTVYRPHADNTTYPYPIKTLDESDYSQLIDIKNFSFTMLANPCNSSYPFLIILVHSAPKNFDKRQTIRETWGSSVNNMKTLFMLGQVKDKDLRKKLERENETYGDFVQGTFDDAYRNLTYKHAMVFKYVIYHCPHIKYLLKVDDDVFVNTYTILDYLKTKLLHHRMSNLLVCYVIKNSPALRMNGSKWKVSFKEYPDKFYPPYCSGWAIIYSHNVIFSLYKELQNTTYFWIDDALITGILFKKLNFTHLENSLILPGPQMELRIVRNVRRTSDMRQYWATAGKHQNFKSRFTNQSEIVKG